MKRFAVACFLVVTIFELVGQVNKYGVPLVKTDSLSKIDLLIETVYANKMPIGISSKMDEKNFKRLILEIQDHPMDKQKELLEENLAAWMGQSPQTDDVIVLGIRT